MHRDQIGERTRIAYFLEPWGFAKAGLRRLWGVRHARYFFRIAGRRRPDWIRGADLANPNDTETGLTPEPADFDGLARRS